MTPAPILLASDVHLGSGDAPRERAFLSWLEAAGSSASAVVVNGDLFDFWFEYRDVIPRGHTRVLGALARLVDAGIPVTLMGGNHDWWGGSYLTDEVGVTFLQAPAVLELGSFRTLLAHGDGLGAGDLGYRILQKVLRGGVTRAAFRWLHPDIGARIARAVSRTEVRAPVRDPEVGRPAALRRWAVGQLERDPSLALVALGHSHHPELLEVTPGRFYLNSGDWLVHRSYAVLPLDGPPRLEVWR